MKLCKQGNYLTNPFNYSLKDITNSDNQLAVPGRKILILCISRPSIKEYLGETHEARYAPVGNPGIVDITKCTMESELNKNSENA